MLPQPLLWFDRGITDGWGWGPDPKNPTYVIENVGELVTEPGRPGLSLYRVSDKLLDVYSPGGHPARYFDDFLDAQEYLVSMIAVGRI